MSVTVSPTLSAFVLVVEHRKKCPLKQILEVTALVFLRWFGFKFRIRKISVCTFYFALLEVSFLFIASGILLNAKEEN